MIRITSANISVHRKHLRPVVPQVSDNEHEDSAQYGFVFSKKNKKKNKNYQGTFKPASKCNYIANHCTVYKGHFHSLHLMNRAYNLNLNTRLY